MSDGDDHNDAVRMEEEERFLERFKSLGYDPYFYRKELLYDDNGHFKSHREEIFMKLFPDRFDRVQKLGPQFIEAMDLGTVKHYSFSELEEITGSFNESNFIIHKTYYGRLFRGKISNEDVIVKTWDFSFKSHSWCYANTHRIIDELVFLRDPEIKSHPSVVDLVGFHCDKNLVVVYKGIWPEYCLKDILLSDEFGWEDRMKVATDIGTMLKIFHDKKHVHGGVCTEFIMLDKKFCSKIFQFQLFSYCENFEKSYRPYEFIGLAEFTRAQKKVPGEWAMIDDIFTYGLLLIQLITKQGYKYMLGSKWICEWMYNHPKSIVDQSMDVDEETGSKITNLAFDCLRAKVNSMMNMEVTDMSKVVYDLKTILDSGIRAPKRQKSCV